MDCRIFLIVVAALVQCVIGLNLVAIPSDNAKDTAHELLSNKHDVRGHYEDVVLVVVGEDRLPELHISFPQARLLSAYNPERQYLVLERQELEFLRNRNKVPFSIPDNQIHQVKVLFQSQTRLVVELDHNEVDSFTRTLPIDMIFLRVPEFTIAPEFRLELNTEIAEIYSNISKKLKEAPSPVIQDLVNRVTGAQLRAIVTYLSGENTTSGITTRNSYSQGALLAAKWVQDRFTAYGLQARQEVFRTGWAPNVIGILPGTTDPSKNVIVCAHYDSRASDVSSPTQRAPGANDNGSGSGTVIQIAKIFSEAKAKFKYTIHFVVFAGEEQGLVGSADYASKLARAGTQVLGVLNADMVAYRVPTENPQLAFASRSSTPALNTLLREITQTYVTGLTIGTSTACCTDHASFFNNGFPAASYFERNGAIADPMYHNVGDLVVRTGYDLTTQYPKIVQGVLAGVATIAEPAV